MVYGGIHWSGVSAVGMGESQGAVSPSEALTFHWLHLSGLMVGFLGGRSDVPLLGMAMCNLVSLGAGDKYSYGPKRTSKSRLCQLARAAQH